MAQIRYYTTQQIAKLLGVSAPTVVNWIKQGRLDAHKTPGGHRRISHDALERFASSYAYPLPGGSAEPSVSTAQRVLVVDRERDFGEMVGEYLQLKGGYEVRIASHALEAGFFLGSFRPHLVILDLQLDDVSGQDLGRLALDHIDGQSVRMLGSTTFLDDLPEERFDALGLNGVVEKPVKLDELLATIQGVLG